MHAGACVQWAQVGALQLSPEASPRGTKQKPGSPRIHAMAGSSARRSFSASTLHTPAAASQT